jgi:hypothetical protein
MDVPPAKSLLPGVMEMAAPAAIPAPMPFLKKSLRFICLVLNSISPKFTISRLQLSLILLLFKPNFERFKISGQIMGTRLERVQSYRSDRYYSGV